MSMLALGLLFGGVTLLVMFSGMPIAFSLGFVAIVFMYFFMPASSLDTVTQNVYEEMASITLLSIPLFILKGAAIGKSDAGKDLYSAMHAWMQRIPGGLGIANVFTCGSLVMGKGNFLYAHPTDDNARRWSKLSKLTKNWPKLEPLALKVND